MTTQRDQRVEEWRLAARRNRERRDDLLPYLFFGMFGTGMAVEVVRSNILWWHGELTRTEAWLGRLNFMFITLVATLLISASVRYQQIKRWFAVIERLAVGATCSRELSAFAEWLGTHWSGDFDDDKICGGLGYVFVAHDVEPRWAISIAPRSLRDGSIERHLRVFVPSRPGQPLTERAERLGPLGFECRIDEAGLIATLDIERLKRIVVEPEQLEPLFGAIRELFGRSDQSH